MADVTASDSVAKGAHGYSIVAGEVDGDAVARKADVGKHCKAGAGSDVQDDGSSSAPWLAALSADDNANLAATVEIPPTERGECSSSCQPPGTASLCGDGYCRSLAGSRTDHPAEAPEKLNSQPRHDPLAPRTDAAAAADDCSGAACSVHEAEAPAFVAPSSCGDHHTGHHHAEDIHTRGHHTEDIHTGDNDTGHHRTEDHHTGDTHAGDHHTEDDHTVHHHTGDKHTGDQYTSDHHTGDDGAAQNDGAAEQSTCGGDRHPPAAGNPYGRAEPTDEADANPPRKTGGAPASRDEEAVAVALQKATRGWLARRRFRRLVAAGEAELEEELRAAAGRKVLAFLRERTARRRGKKQPPAGTPAGPAAACVKAPGGGTERDGNDDDKAPGGGTETDGNDDGKAPGGGTETDGNDDDKAPGGGTETDGNDDDNDHKAPGGGTETDGNDEDAGDASCDERVAVAMQKAIRGWLARKRFRRLVAASEAELEEELRAAAGRKILAFLRQRSGRTPRPQAALSRGSPAAGTQEAARVGVSADTLRAEKSADAAQNASSAGHGWPRATAGCKGEPPAAIQEESRVEVSADTLRAEKSADDPQNASSAGPGSPRATTGRNEKVAGAIQEKSEIDVSANGDPASPSEEKVAVALQKAIRGWLARKRFQRLIAAHEAELEAELRAAAGRKILAFLRERTAARKKRGKRPQAGPAAGPAALCDEAPGGVCSTHRTHDDAAGNASCDERVAVAMQKAIRGWLARKRFQRLIAAHEAELEAQLRQAAGKRLLAFFREYSGKPGKNRGAKRGGEGSPPGVSRGKPTDGRNPAGIPSVPRCETLQEASDGGGSAAAAVGSPSNPRGESAAAAAQRASGRGGSAGAAHCPRDPKAPADAHTETAEGSPVDVEKSSAAAAAAVQKAAAGAARSPRDPSAPADAHGIAKGPPADAESSAAAAVQCDEKLAVALQKAIRGWLARRRFQRLLAAQDAACEAELRQAAGMKLLAFFRVHSGRKPARPGRRQHGACASAASASDAGQLSGAPKTPSGAAHAFKPKATKLPSIRLAGARQRPKKESGGTPPRQANDDCAAPPPGTRPAGKPLARAKGRPSEDGAEAASNPKYCPTPPAEPIQQRSMRGRRARGLARAQKQPSLESVAAVLPPIPNDGSPEEVLEMPRSDPLFAKVPPSEAVSKGSSTGGRRLSKTGSILPPVAPARHRLAATSHLSKLLHHTLDSIRVYCTCSQPLAPPRPPRKQHVHPRSDPRQRRPSPHLPALPPAPAQTIFLNWKIDVDRTFQT